LLEVIFTRLEINLIRLYQPFEVNFDSRCKATILQHNALENSSPSHEEKACATRFVDNVLTGLSASTLNSIQVRRKKIGKFYKEFLVKVNTNDLHLSEEDKLHLQELVQFTHPR